VASGLDRDSVALLEQIRTIDKRRLRDYVGALEVDDMSAVDKALAVSVGLKNEKMGGTHHANQKSDETAN
jgi:mRNA interferase MazF